MDEYVRIKGLHFEHGHKQLLDALGSETRTSVPGKRIVIHSVALSWRFVRKKVKGQVRWYVHVTLDVPGPALVTDREKGAIGVDFNSAHVDLGEMDASGNPVGYERISMYLWGRRAGQRTAIIGDTVKEIVERARESQKSVVIENLEFSGKKAKLEGVSPGRARTLTSLAYRKFEEMLRAACFRAGVEVREVNPAWTSLIGTFQYAQPLGISSHEAAAIVIARRSRHFRRSLALLPCGTGPGFRSATAIMLPSLYLNGIERRPYGRSGQKRARTSVPRLKRTTGVEPVRATHRPHPGPCGRRAQLFLVVVGETHPVPDQGALGAVHLLEVVRRTVAWRRYSNRPPQAEDWQN